MEKMFLVKFVGEQAVFSVSVIADDDWQARRKAEIHLADGFGFDVSLMRWHDVEIIEEGVFV